MISTFKKVAFSGLLMIGLLSFSGCERCIQCTLTTDTIGSQEYPEVCGSKDDRDASEDACEQARQEYLAIFPTGTASCDCE